MHSNSSAVNQVRRPGTPTELTDDYRANSRKSIDRAEDAIKHLRKFLGPSRALDRPIRGFAVTLTVALIANVFLRRYSFPSGFSNCSSETGKLRL